MREQTIKLVKEAYRIGEDIGRLQIKLEEAKKHVYYLE